MAERFQINISPEDQGLPIKELLKRRLGLSSRLLRKLKQDEKVFLNGEPVKMFEKGKAGDCITLSLPEETSGFIAESIPIEVIYEDDDLLAINKQPGYVVHPTKGHPSHTIANGVMSYMMTKGDSYKIRFINRLDMDTTGLLLIGKNSHCQDDFARQAAAGRVEKRYVALVQGHLTLDEGTINLPIGKPIDDQVKRAVIPEGYPSITHFRVIERYKKPYTLVELLLETGRTHQIRVHMAHMGHPVVGDALYGGEAVWMIERQALHAVRLDFDHPVTGERLSLQAPVPEDMRALMGKF
jgi:23S rRNA pseudouridine1911/1915/1917 synthase